MKLIPIYKTELFTLVDDDKFEFLNKFRWTLHKTKTGLYARRRKGNKSFYLHREIMQIGDPNIQVDHVDGNGLNNQIHNLRICNNFQNSKNSRKRGSYGTSKYKGVSLFKRDMKWQAYINFNYVRVHLGYFENENEAALAYDQAARFFHKRFANLNFPEKNEKVIQLDEIILSYSDRYRERFEMLWLELG